MWDYLVARQKKVFQKVLAELGYPSFFLETVVF